MFREFKLKGMGDESEVLVNLDDVRFVRRAGEGSKIIFKGGREIYVTESYTNIKKMVSGPQPAVTYHTKILISRGRFYYVDKGIWTTQGRDAAKFNSRSEAHRFMITHLAEYYNKGELSIDECGVPCADLKEAKV